MKSSREQFNRRAVYLQVSSHSKFWKRETFHLQQPHARESCTNKVRATSDTVGINYKHSSTLPGWRTRRHFCNELNLRRDRDARVSSPYSTQRFSISHVGLFAEGEIFQAELRDSGKQGWFNERLPLLRPYLITYRLSFWWRSYCTASRFHCFTLDFMFLLVFWYQRDGRLL